MSLNTIVKVGGAVLLVSSLVTGLQFKQGSHAHQAARFLVGEPVKAALVVGEFVRDSLEEVRQTPEQKPKNEEERGNPAKEQPIKPEHGRVVPEVLGVLPSAGGTINVRTRIDKQLINVAIDREQVESLQARDRQAPNRVDITFTVKDEQYTAVIDKDMLIAALANRNR